MRSERRAKKRIKISYYIPVNNADSLEKLGILTEINTKGLQVDTQTLLTEGKAYKLRLDLMNPSLGASHITFSAVVRWIRSDQIEPNFYNIGLEILELSATERDVIEKIMASYSRGIFT